MFRNTNTFAPCSRRVINQRTKRTAAHTCRICGRHIYGNASICADCLMKQTEEGGRHYGK